MMISNLGTLTPLTDAARDSALLELARADPFSWTPIKNQTGLHKTFHFTDFSQAFGFMTRSALLAEKMDHHPEWFNVYNTVEVTLTTHTCGALSQKDIDMAKAMDRYAQDIMPGAET